MRTGGASIPLRVIDNWIIRDIGCNPALIEWKTQMGKLGIMQIRAHEFWDQISCHVLLGTINKAFIHFSPTNCNSE